MAGRPDGTTTEEVEAAFVAGAEARRRVRLVDAAGRERLVEPYMVYVAGTGRRLLHFFQVAGHSAGGVPVGWKNPGADAFRRAWVTDEPFTLREDYNPLNRPMFPRVVFALPTRDGRRRAPDEPPPGATDPA